MDQQGKQPTFQSVTFYTYGIITMGGSILVCLNFPLLVFFCMKMQREVAMDEIREIGK